MPEKGTLRKDRVRVPGAGHEVASLKGRIVLTVVRAAAKVALDGFSAGLAHKIRGF